VELWRYYRILRRRKWVIFTTTFLCLVAVAISIALRKNYWEAYTTLMERTPGRAEVSIYQEPMYYQLELETRLANLAYLAGSQTVLERTAQTLYELGVSSDPAKILRTVSIEPVRDTEIILIKVYSESQEEARTTADTLAAEFRRFYDELQRGGTTQSKQFIEQQLPIARQEMLDAQAAVKEFKEKNKLVSYDDQSTMLLQRLSQLQTEAASAKVQVDDLRSQVRTLQEQLKDQDPVRLSSTTMADNPILQSLKESRVKAEVELQKARVIGNKTDEHPDVAALLAQIAEIDKKMKTEEQRIWNSEVTSRNPIYDNLFNRLAETRASLAAAEARQIAVEQVIAEMKPQLEELPQKEMEFARLSLDQTNAEETYKLLRSKLDEAKIKEQETVAASSIVQVDPAKVREVPRRLVLKTMLALILGPLFGAGIAFMMHYLDNTVKSPAEAEALLGTTVFAVIPTADRKALMGSTQSPAIGASYQILATNLWFASNRVASPTILVASAEPDVGRSTVVANLGVSLAKDGARIIIVDSDLRQPAQHTIFGVNNEKGLSNILAGQLTIEEAVIPIGDDGLLVIPSGPLPSNPVRLFRSAEMKQFVEEISKHADFVLFDSPAGIAFADSALLAALVKNVILVHSAGRVPRGAEAEFRQRLDQVQANIIGAVLNRVRPEESHGYYHYRRSYEDYLTRDGKFATELEARVAGAIPEKTESQEETETQKQ